MDELYELVDNLKSYLDNLEDIKNIKDINNKLSNNKDLLNKIDLYRKTSYINLKKEILSNKDYKEYKRLESNINLLILQINTKLKELVPRRNHENN